MAFGVNEELKIIVKAEVDKAVAGLKQVQGTAGGIERNIKSLGMAAVKYLGPAFLAGAVIKAGKAAVGAAAQYEKLNVQLKVLMGSADSANRLFGALREFAVKTPFQLEQLAQASTQLLAYGTAAKDIIPTLQNLGNAALGQSDKLDRLVLAYGKLQTKGKATLEELNMFTEAGVPLMQALADQIGITKQEVFEYVTAGKVGFAEVNEAIKALTTGQGQFAGMLEENSKTLIGLMSTAKDSVTDLAATIGNELIDSIKDATTAFTDFVNGIGSAITGTQALKDSLTGTVSIERQIQALEEQQQFLRSGFRGMAGQQAVGIFAQLGNIITGNDEAFARQRALNQLRSELANIPPELREAEAQAIQVQIDLLKARLAVEQRITAETDKQSGNLELGTQIVAGVMLIDGKLHGKAGAFNLQRTLTSPRPSNDLLALRQGVSDNPLTHLYSTLAAGGVSQGGSVGFPYTKTTEQLKAEALYWHQLSMGRALVGSSGAMPFGGTGRFGLQEFGFSPFLPGGGVYRGGLSKPIEATQGNITSPAAMQYGPLGALLGISPFQPGGGVAGSSIEAMNLLPIPIDELEEYEKALRAAKAAMKELIAQGAMDIGINAFLAFGEAIGQGGDALENFARSIPGLIGEMAKLIGLQLMQYGMTVPGQKWAILAGLGIAFGGSALVGLGKRDWTNNSSTGGGGNVFVQQFEINGDVNDANMFDSKVLSALSKARTGYR